MRTLGVGGRVSRITHQRQLAGFGFQFGGEVLRSFRFWFRRRYAGLSFWLGGRLQDRIEVVFDSRFEFAFDGLMQVAVCS